ncbi:MAG TPA: ABC transporter ATP-binding protein, partial [Clostridiales bacterium]|nr:ABC transporter ATP-binding protein [Clostridiales bacterium]
MNKLTLLYRFLKGSRLTYLGALIAVIANVGITTLVPRIISLTLDYVIGDEPLAASSGAGRLIGLAGGLDTLRANLWILMAVLIVLALLQGCLHFLRTKLAALTGENTAKRMRDRIFLHVLRQPFNYHVQVQTGDIIQRCTS